jgi:hypothetical protein
MSERPHFPGMQPRERIGHGAGLDPASGVGGAPDVGVAVPLQLERDVALRLRPTVKMPEIAFPGREDVFHGLLRAGPDAARRLRVTYLLRKEAPLEVALAVTVPLTPPTAKAPLSKRALETLARVAFPGLAPVAPTRPLLAGPVVALRMKGRDALAALSQVVQAPRPRPIVPEVSGPLLLPAAGAPELAIDCALIGLADARLDVDLVLDLTAAPLTAEDRRALTGAQRQLFAATYTEGAGGQASAALVEVERWLRIQSPVMRLKASLHFASTEDSAAGCLAERLLFNSGAGVAFDAGADGVDLSGCVLPGAPIPALAVHPLAVAALAMRAARHRPRAPRGAALTLGADELGRAVAVGLEDLRQHFYVVGQTGTGKSNFLKRLALADAAVGTPIVVVDPHGDLYGELLEQLPRSVLSRAFVADVSDFDAPFALNILEVKGPHAAIQRNFIANQLIALFKSVYGANRDAFGPVFEQYFRSALFLLMDAGGPEATLLDLERVFGEASYRRTLLENCSDPTVVSFWKNIALRAGGEISLENVSPYITSKLNQLSGNPLVRPIMCAPRSTLDLPVALAEGRSVLVNLAKGQVGGTDAGIIGGIFTIRLLAAAMARASLPMAERRLTRVLLDEFQVYGAHGIAEALAEVRKYGLSLVLANQSVAQIDGRSGDIAHAILGNVGNLAVFRVGPKDATTLAEWLGPEVLPATLMRLPNHECITRLLHSGVPMPASVVRTGLTPLP